MSERNEDEETFKAGEIIEEVLACEMLEYHDSNWLDGDPKQRCERKIERLKEALRLLGHETPTGW